MWIKKYLTGLWGEGYVRWKNKQQKNPIQTIATSFSKYKTKQKSRTERAYRHSASASKCLECLWSMMTRSWCFSKKHSRADSGVRAMLHLKLAFSHAQQKPLLWLSSLAKTKSTCKKKKKKKLMTNATEQFPFLSDVLLCLPKIYSFSGRTLQRATMCGWC